MSSKAELEQDIVKLHRQLAVAKGRHESLKKKVVEEARRGCEEHGWCDEIKEILGRLRLLSYWPSDWVVQYRRRRPAAIAQNDPWGHWDEWSLNQHREDAEESLVDARENYTDSYWEYQFRLAEQTGDGKIKVIRGV